MIFTYLQVYLGVIHKRLLLKRGRKGDKECRNIHSKKTTKEEGGGHKIGKMGRHCLWMPLSIIAEIFSSAQICHVSPIEKSHSRFNVST